MIDKTIEELMWLEIDESISADDHERLWSHLDAHREDRGHFDHLRELSELFSRAVDLDPPPELRIRIRRALQTASREWIHTSEHPSLWARFREFATPRPAWRVAAAALAGVFIGIIGYHVVSYRPDAPRTLDMSQFYGTMGLRSVHGGGSGVTIDLPAASGRFAVEREGSFVHSKLVVKSESEIHVVIDYNGTAEGSAVKYGGEDPADRSSNQITVEDHGIHVRNRGEGTYFFVFQLSDDPTSPFVVRIIEEDAVLFEETVIPERASKNE